MNKDFSILLASRGRKVILGNMLHSVKERTQNLDSVEVLVGIDDDDKDTQEAVPILEKTFPFAKFRTRERGTNLHRDYINWLWQLEETGKWLFVINDDCRFQTPEWDRHLRTILNNYQYYFKDRLVYGNISDGVTNYTPGSYSCFPLVSQEAAKALGFVMPNEFPGWTADIALHRIYEAVGRVCDCRQVLVQHYTYHTGSRERDETSYHMQTISAEPHKPVPYTKYINRLQAVIDEAMATKYNRPPVEKTAVPNQPFERLQQSYEFLDD